jgi:Fe-S cluster biogenesis protein NfuA
MFIQTEATPNPATIKFLPGKAIASGSGIEFKNLNDAKSYPFVAEILRLENVSSVFLGEDFIAVTKNNGEWQHIKPFILGILMEHLAVEPHLLPSASLCIDDENFDPKDAETVKAIRELIDTRVRPNVLSDGGDITFRAFRDGIVFVAMKGACSGCPSSSATLKHGIENLLRHYVPEVVGVEQI